MFYKKLDYKYYLVLILSQALLLILTIGCIFIHSDRAYKQLEFYKGQAYSYMYETTNTVKRNDYYNASFILSFYDTEESKESLYCDVYMLNKDSIYDDVAPWGELSYLKEREIAVSYNLAKAYNISVGDNLYSKHVVRNQVESYEVKKILPVCYGVTIMDFELNRGVIIMGNDSDYIDNISATYLGFSQEDPSALIQGAGSGLISLKAKQDAVLGVQESLIVWQVLHCTLASCLTILFVGAHWRYQKVYYTKLALNGDNLFALKKKLWIDLILPGLLALLTAGIGGGLISSLRNYYFSYMTSLVSMICAGVSLLISVIIYVKKGVKI